MSNDELQISMVIPAYNEGNRILSTLLSILEYFSARGLSHEVIVVDDGSHDNTEEVVREVGQRFPCIKLIQLARNMGKGAAVRTGVLNAVGRFIMFNDADGATPASEIERLLTAIDNGADVAIGSRALGSPETHIKRTWKRVFVGRVFALLVRMLAVPGISDPQCGFKMFRRDVAYCIFKIQKLNGFAFDVEVLRIASALGYRIAEVPVNWSDVQGSKVRLVRDSLRMLLDIYRIRAMVQAAISRIHESSDPHPSTVSFEGETRIFNTRAEMGQVPASPSADIPPMTTEGNALSAPTVSFVIPVLNSEKYIARCIHAIRNLKCQEGDYEVLIMDNGSTDHTHEILRSLGSDFEVIPKVHVGALRNRGAFIARGQYMAFVDADVEISPFWLQHALAMFKDPDVVAGGCFPTVPEDPTWVQYIWDLHQRGRQPVATSAAVPWLPSMNLIVRRDAFLAVGGFNEQLETAEDVDLCYRLGQRGGIHSNPAMAAIHWGEAKDLQTFWRKEVWRGIGNLKGVLSHGLRWDELPSLGYPLYTIAIGVLFGLCLMRDIWYRQILLAPWCIVLLIIPALTLALNTARLANCANEFPKLFLLYFMYGMARAYSIIKVAGRLSR